jgi:hypothetical protein
MHLLKLPSNPHHFGNCKWAARPKLVHFAGTGETPRYTRLHFFATPDGTQGKHGILARAGTLYAKFKMQK